MLKRGFCLIARISLSSSLAMTSWMTCSADMQPDESLAHILLGSSQRHCHTAALHPSANYTTYTRQGHRESPHSANLYKIRGQMALVHLAPTCCIEQVHAGDARTLTCWQLGQPFQQLFLSLPDAETKCSKDASHECHDGSTGSAHVPCLGELGFRRRALLRLRHILCGIRDALSSPCAGPDSLPPELPGTLLDGLSSGFFSGSFSHTA